jgi:hypothetical protein
MGSGRLCYNLGMFYNNLMLSQHEPAHSSGLKLLLMLIPALLLGAGIYLWSTGETEGAQVLAIESLIFALVLWLVIPRAYQVFDDSLRIVLGGPLALKIPFAQIERIEITGRNALAINLVSVVRRSYVIIVRKHGWAFAITPEHSEVFVAAATSALNQWARNNQANLKR